MIRISGVSLLLSGGVLCSGEHERHSSSKTLATPHSFTATPATHATHAAPATGIKLVAETSLKSLKAVLETIRERADYALKQIQESEEERSMRWQCKDCEYVKHFTRPVPLEATGRCPRCKNSEFEVVT